MSEVQSIEEDHEAVGTTQWILIASSAAVSLILGNLAACLSGFPFYPGWQGALVQQPWITRIAAVLAILLSAVVCGRVAGALVGWGGRMISVSLGLLAAGAFSIRGGTMASVLQAAGGREVFWELAAELAVLGLVAWALFSMAGRVTGLAEGGKTRPGVSGNTLVQLLVTAGVLWVLGRSYDKMQAMGAVFFASMVGAIFGSDRWKGAWCIPLVVGMVGYIGNALSGSGLETADLRGWAGPLAMPLPLDYLAMGPLGAALGMLVFHLDAEEDEDTATTPVRRKAV